MAFAQPKSQYSHVLKPYPSGYIVFFKYYSITWLMGHMNWQLVSSYPTSQSSEIWWLNWWQTFSSVTISRYHVTNIYIYTYILYTYILYIYIHIYAYVCMYVCMYVIIKTISPDSYQTHALEQMLFVLQYIYGNIYIYR